MKKLVCFMLALTMCLAVLPALALNYQQHQANEATFETLEEARANGPVFLMEQYPDRTFTADPCLDGYPVGTTYVYRSAGMYDLVTAAVRMNTNLLVYVDQKFESKDDAFNYLKGLGLIDMADEITGSVILVSPITEESEGSSGKVGGFGGDDAYAFYLLQSAMCNIGGGFADSGYYGGLTYRYLIGIDGGATFINNYIASTFDDITRIAGLLLVNGSMQKIREVAGPVPVWMVNPEEATIAKYAAANQADCKGREGDVEYLYNQQLPLQKVVITRTEDVDVAKCVHDAYYDMFIKAMRIPVTVSGLYTSNTPFRGYSWNQAPYSLGDRNPIINGKTPDGIYVTEVKDPEQFAEFKTENGEYFDTWYEFLPEEVLNGTAPEHSVPFILFNHGGGDDPLQAVDEVGLLKLIGEERIAVFAAPYQDVYMGGAIVLKDILPKCVEYMLNKYPALDPARVYTTGYSMGGGTTYWAFNGNPKMFAAAVSMAGNDVADFEGKADLYADADIPFMLLTSTGDIAGMNWNTADNCISDSFKTLFQNYLSYNEMDTFEYDTDTYPLSGFKGDSYVERKLNGEYMNYQWLLNNKDGIPMMGLNITEYLPHGLYQEYARLFWDFVKHYSRDLETGEVVYHPYLTR